jgi:hypothetical protein
MIISSIWIMQKKNQYQANKSEYDKKMHISAHSSQ